MNVGDPKVTFEQLLEEHKDEGIGDRIYQELLDQASDVVNEELGTKADELVSEYCVEFMEPKVNLAAPPATRPRDIYYFFEVQGEENYHLSLQNAFEKGNLTDWKSYVKTGLRLTRNRVTERNTRGYGYEVQNVMDTAQKIYSKPPFCHFNSQRLKDARRQKNPRYNRYLLEDAVPFDLDDDSAAAEYLGNLPEATEDDYERVAQVVRKEVPPHDRPLSKINPETLKSKRAAVVYTEEEVRKALEVVVNDLPGFCVHDLYGIFELVLQSKPPMSLVEGEGGNHDGHFERSGGFDQSTLEADMLGPEDEVLIQDCMDEFMEILGEVQKEHLLRYFDEHSKASLADFLGVSAPTERQRLKTAARTLLDSSPDGFRAWSAFLQRLRPRLEEELGSPTSSEAQDG